MLLITDRLWHRLPLCFAHHFILLATVAAWLGLDLAGSLMTNPSLIQSPALTTLVFFLDANQPRPPRLWMLHKWTHLVSGPGRDLNRWQLTAADCMGRDPLCLVGLKLGIFETGSFQVKWGDKTTDECPHLQQNIRPIKVSFLWLTTSHHYLHNKDILSLLTFHLHLLRNINLSESRKKVTYWRRTCINSCLQKI